MWGPGPSCVARMQRGVIHKLSGRTLREGRNRYVPGMAMRGSRPAVAAAAVIAVLMTGCTDDASPVETVTPSATASQTSSPTPSPTAVAALPKRPEAMATPSAEGAAAAASYFISLFAYINGTGDFAEWDVLSSPDCSFCSGVRADAAARAEKGLRSLVEVRVESAEGTEVDPQRWYSAELHVFIGESTDVDSSGQTVATRAAEEHRVYVVMTWQDSSWVIDEVGPSTRPTS